MCGITGLFDTTASTPEDQLTSLVRRMAETILHRGPDDSGEWVDETAGIGLGFRRLAIIDLSMTGHQPMRSADRRYTIIFNGEVYNYDSLRHELLEQGAKFKGTSDTEVMLAAIQFWGLARAVRRFNGMFAFALWDSQDRTLHLVRDRMGIKPLYYAWVGKTLVFGSELKTLVSHPNFQKEVDRDALTLYLRFAYIPTPYSIYKKVYKLSPGCILSVQINQTEETARPKAYWNAQETIERSLAEPFEGDETEAIDTLEKHLQASLSLRMIADVPLGAFLSGGVDSSTVVALMQTQASRPVKTFTIGFNEAGFDEAAHAKAIAKHLGTEHTELYVSPEEMRDVVPLLPQLYDEPFADVSQIPTYVVSRMARQHVTVSLSGDGGDEIFGGYNRYTMVPKLWRRASAFPKSMRKALSTGLRLVSPNEWKNVFLAAGKVSSSLRNLPNPADKAHKLADLLSAPGPSTVYLELLSQWKDPNQLVLQGHEPRTAVTDLAAWVKSPNFSEQMMALDMITYLPDDILTKVDRASMGASLEARAPFLDDHETVRLAWQFPLHMKINSQGGKWILRQVLYRHVPKKLVDRPKMGFGVPMDSWLRGPLRDWAEDLLSESRLRSEGYFNPTPIRQKWEEHLSGVRNWQNPLWTVLMFQSWLQSV